jgi:hypothetical protein
MMTRISRKLRDEADGAEVRGDARLVGLAALLVAALAMIAVLALALYGAQHVLQTMVT